MLLPLLFFGLGTVVVRQSEASPICNRVSFLQLCRAVCGGRLVETIPRKSLKCIISFVCVPPTGVGVAGSIKEPVIRMHFPLSADELFKRWNSV